MVLFFYILLNIIVIFCFTKIKKKLHVLEIMVYWMVGTYLYQNFSALCYMNFKTLLIPDKFSYEIAHFLNRVILFPILMVTFLHFYRTLYSNSQKLLLISSNLVLLAGLEWLAHFLGVIIHVHWQIWWSFAFWLAALLVLIGFMKFFRKYLYKGVSKV